MEAATQSEQEFINAKAYLLGTSTRTELNLYDHLAAVLTTILDERPDNVVDIFEELSHHQKQTKFTSDVDTVQDKIDKSTEVALAQIQEKLFKKGDGEGDEQDMEQEDMESPLPNLMETAYFFEQAGIGLNREELVRIWLSLKDLNDTKPLQHIRFWGKIFGVEQSYVVAEVEYREGEEEEVEEEEEAEEKEDEEAADRDEDAEDDEETEEDVIPKPDYKPPPKVPREEYRQGTNKKTYFVCNEAGKPWTRLPNVTPEQITVARKMKKFFTGRLDAPVICYPPFPGNESNYLRAQIARISAGTQISPLNFYTFEEDEDMDEEVGRDEFSKNPDFEEIPVRDLVDPSLSNWVHHVLHILPQGRCNWWNPVQRNEEEFEDEDEDEEREEPDEPVPETGPHLLTPLSEDAELDSMPAWTAKLSSNLILQYSVAVIHSNLWPGSHAFCDEKKFENIYIGYGHKYSGQTFSPQAAPQIQEEFPSGPEITEVDDPTPEEEAALQAAKIEAAEAAEEVEEGEEDEDEDD